jgi:outer membrane protein insertion porin family
MGLSVRVVRGLAICSLVLGGLLVGAVTLGVTGAAPAAAQSAQSIAVEGNRRVEADTIRSYFKPNARGQVDAVQLDEGLKALINTGLFEDVRINHAGGRPVVTVVEAQVINRVAFEGNKKSKDDQLSGEIQSKARGTLSRATVQADVQRLLDVYRRNGRYDVRIVPKVIELPNNRVDLVFEINEGDKTGINSINFAGNRAFSSYRLKDVVKTTASGWFSFLQSSDIYDADRLGSDRDLLRRFYLKNGYADVRITSAVAEYDPAAKGFVVTFTIDEGEQYRVGSVDVTSSIRAVDPQILRSRVKLGRGDVYNADLVEKTVEGMTIEAAKRGYAFATVRPQGERNYQNKTITLAFVIEEGPRAYIERINIRGNIRTRDYVIRREFDIGEGDAYNRGLVDRAERRLNNLGYFKKVKITNEPGSAPDRVVLNVDVEERSTGNFSIAGGYSTAEGWLAELSVTETNLMGRGQYAKASLQYGQYARGFELSFAEPYFLDYRLGAGIDLYAKQNLASSFVSYDLRTIGTNLRLAFALNEEISLTPRYSIYQRELDIPAGSDCNPAVALPSPPNPPGTFPINCASFAARSLNGQSLLTSAVGYTAAYNTLDNNKNPTSGLYAEIKQDVAGAGGDVNFIRTSGDVRYYTEVLPDVVGLLRLQGGHVTAWGGDTLSILDHFQMGPNLVRGFASAGIGPRDLTPNSFQDALGGTKYWGTTAELQTPIYFFPKEIGIKFATFVDAGSLWDYQGITQIGCPGPPATCQRVQPGNSNDGMNIRASAGVGFLWDSPLGPIRFDFAWPLKKESWDNLQWFRFSGGTSF